jgi:hypothetical protein
MDSCPYCGGALVLEEGDMRVKPLCQYGKSGQDLITLEDFLDTPQIEMYRNGKWVDPE